MAIRCTKKTVISECKQKKMNFVRQLGASSSSSVSARCAGSKLTACCSLALVTRRYSVRLPRHKQLNEKGEEIQKLSWIQPVRWLKKKRGAEYVPEAICYICSRNIPKRLCNYSNAPDDYLLGKPLFLYFFLVVIVLICLLRTIRSG